MVINRAIFFDRDGVLNKNIYYKKYGGYEAPLFLKDLKINKNTRALARLEKKFIFFVITNQPAAAKKKTTVKEINKIKNYFLVTLNKKIKIKKYLQCLNTEGVKKNYCKKFSYCFFKKKNKEICKKPSNILIEYCLQKYKIDRKKSYFIGDRKKDMQAAKKSDIKFIFFKNNKNTEVISNKDYMLKTDSMKKIYNEIK